MATGTRPVGLVRLNVDVSPDLERVISRCLEHDRERRYQHAADIRSDLQRLKRDTDSTHTHVLAQAKLEVTTAARRRRAIVPAATTAFALLTAVYIVYSNFH